MRSKEKGKLCSSGMMTLFTQDTDVGKKYFAGWKTIYLCVVVGVNEKKKCSFMSERI